MSQRMGNYFRRNSQKWSIAFAIFNYTDLLVIIPIYSRKGLEVLIGIARFGTKELLFKYRNQYVILGVTR